MKQKNYKNEVMTFAGCTDVNAVDQPPSRHPEVPKARQHFEPWSVQSRHPELVSGSIHLIKNHDEAMNKTLSIGQSVNNLQSLKIDSDFRQNDVKAVAFTLAEVLIALGIIGIVAAMTIPTIIQNYQERAWNKSAEVFERKLEAALQVMNTQEVLAGYSNTKDFVTELANHFKITKICDTPTECFEDTVYWNVIDISAGTTVTTINISDITTASDLGQEDWNTEALGIQFANGTNGVIAYNPDCTQDPYSNQITGTSCISLIYDTTGYTKPNTYTKDLRGINSLLADCAFKSGSTCYGAPFKTTYLTKAECEAQKSDLGLQYCYDGNDYYAGAAAACGGVQNLPSAQQLAELVKYLYNTDTVTSSGRVYGTLDTDKAAALGFTLVSSTWAFSVWLNQESSSTTAYTYRFASTNAYYDTAHTSADDLRRNGSYNHTVCIE